MPRITLEDGRILEGGFFVEEEREVDEVEKLLTDTEYLLEDDEF